jgi:hypothetical protein
LKVYEFLKRVLGQGKEIDSFPSLITNQKTHVNDFDFYWKKIQIQFKNKDFDSWNNLNPDYESEIPHYGEIYKRLFLEKK